MAQLDLEPDLEGLIASLLESGRFSSRNDVVREGLRLLQQQEGSEYLEAALAAGLADADAGRTVPVEEVFERLLLKYQRIAAKQNE